MLLRRTLQTLGCRLPMELHVVHINRVYRTQELALKENDGVAILIYLFQVLYSKLLPIKCQRRTLS